MTFIKNNATSLVALIYLSIMLYKERNNSLSDPANMSIAYLVFFVPLLIFLILIYFKYHRKNK